MASIDIDKIIYLVNTILKSQKLPIIKNDNINITLKKDDYLSYLYIYHVSVIDTGKDFTTINPKNIEYTHFNYNYLGKIQLNIFNKIEIIIHLKKREPRESPIYIYVQNAVTEINYYRKYDIHDKYTYIIDIYINEDNEEIINKLLDIINKILSIMIFIIDI